MRTLIPLIALIALVGCTSGPGSDCGCDTGAEAMPVGAGAQAAASAASGGQQANQAPFADDRARLAPNTVIGRGAGASTLEDSSAETRHVASGGAQNIGVVLPTSAEASTGGGSSPAVIEAAKTVASWRAMLQLCLSDPSSPPDRLETISAGLTNAQSALAAAQAASGTNRTVNHNFQGAKVTLFGVSTSSTAGKPSDAAIEAVTEGVGGVTVPSAVRSDGSFPPAAPESDDLPPAGALPPVPEPVR